MLCSQCEESARGVCRFCGRAVCADHYQSLPYLVAVYGDSPPKAVVVSDTLWCGTCRPQPDPVALPELA